jgi:hypothetical protein
MVIVSHVVGQNILSCLGQRIIPPNWSRSPTIRLAYTGKFDKRCLYLNGEKHILNFQKCNFGAETFDITSEVAFYFSQDTTSLHSKIVLTYLTDKPKQIAVQFQELGAVSVCYITTRSWNGLLPRVKGEMGPSPFIENFACVVIDESTASQILNLMS